MHPTVATTLEAPREQVWDALMEARNYPRWVVGARRFRGADPDWPEPGACFHHSVGIGPLEIKDDTKLLDRNDGSMVVLEARARPAGRAQVTLRLTPEGAKTRVEMAEQALTGPGAWLPGFVHDPLVRRRNREALRRLKQLVETGDA